jgi:hypothetical protein
LPFLFIWKLHFEVWYLDRWPAQSDVPVLDLFGVETGFFFNISISRTPHCFPTHQKESCKITINLSASIFILNNLEGRVVQAMTVNDIIQGLPFSSVQSY